MTILPNGVAVIEGDTHHAVWCATEGLIHDKFTADIIRRLFARRCITTAIDGGAHIGTLTRVMLDEGVLVHAFEPNPEAVECLKHNCPEAIIHPVGLSDAPGLAIFFRLQNAGASYVQSVPDEHPCGVLPQAQLEPLDRYGLSPDFIKLDIEGSECAALRGAANMIARCRPAILVEVNAGALLRAGESKDALAGLLRRFCYGSTIIQPDCSWDSPQFDVLAIPEG